MKIGSEFGNRYKILELLGKGGMGEVYLAEDIALERKVALKFLTEESQLDRNARKRFQREARSASGLDHPFICRVYETGEIEEQAYIVMEFVEGETLQDRLSRGPFQLKEALDTACKIGEALEYAHECCIVHRDLKPSNIMLTPGDQPKIMDFGLAKLLPTQEMLENMETTSISIFETTRGTLVGTPAYMSPEQAMGEPVDIRSDIFSFGVVLYEMLSGLQPFQRKSAVETITSVLRDEYPPLRMEAITTPAMLSDIMKKAMAKNVADRYPSINEMMHDLRLLRDEPVASRPPVSVLIADFTNNTGESVFDNVLEESLRIGLEESPFITSYKRHDARKVAQAINPDQESVKLDVSSALLVAQREGVNLVVTGSIDAADPGYAICVEAADPISEKRIAKSEIKAEGRDAVLEAIARISLQIRKQLGDMEAISADSVARETFTAGSLEAARRYVEAQDLIAAGKYRQAIDAYLDALDIDPELGRAFAGLAAASHNLSRYADAKKYYEEAMKRIDRMTERERHRTLGGYALRTGDSQSAISELETLIEQYPADEAGLSNLAYAYFLKRDMKAAMNLGQRAVQIYPKNILARGNLALYAMYAGEFDYARSEATSVIEMNPGYEKTYVCQAICEIAQGNLVKAEEVYQKLAGISVEGASLSAMGLADMAMYRGRLADARSMLELGITGDVSGNNRYTGPKLAALAGVRLLQGEKQEAVAAASKAVESSKEPRVLYEAADVYIDAGRTSDALLLAKELEASPEPDIQAYAHIISGRIQYREGNRADGIRILEETHSRHDTWLGKYELGRAYLEEGKYPEAHLQFEQCLKHQGEAVAIFLDDVPTLRYLPPVYYYLGRAQEGLGSPDASESYLTFVKIKKRGDESELLTNARNKLSALQ